MVGLFLQSGYALLPSQPHHRVSSRLTRNLILFVAQQQKQADPNPLMRPHVRHVVEALEEATDILNNILAA